MPKVEKMYKFETKNDYIQYLKLLIEYIHKNIRAYKKYVSEIEKMCFEYTKKIDNSLDEISIDIIKDLITSQKYLKIKEKGNVPFDLYRNINDKVLFRSIRLFNAFGDRTKEAMSYLKFRDSISRSEIENLELDELEQEYRELLNSIYHVRNFEAHLPDTQFIAQKMYREEQLKAMGVSNDILLNEEVYVNYYDYVEIEWLWDCYVTTRVNLELFTKLFLRVKKDFSKLVGKSMSIYMNHDKVLPADAMKITMNSVDHHLGNKKAKIRG